MIIRKELEHIMIVIIAIVDVAIVLFSVSGDKQFAKHIIGLVLLYAPHWINAISILITLFIIRHFISNYNENNLNIKHNPVVSIVDEISNDDSIVAIKFSSFTNRSNIEYKLHSARIVIDSKNYVVKSINNGSLQTVVNKMSNHGELNLVVHIDNHITISGFNKYEVDDGVSFSLIPLMSIDKLIDKVEQSSSKDEIKNIFNTVSNKYISIAQINNFISNSYNYIWFKNNYHNYQYIIQHCDEIIKPIIDEYQQIIKKYDQIADEFIQQKSPIFLQLKLQKQNGEFIYTEYQEINSSKFLDKARKSNLCLNPEYSLLTKTFEVYSESIRNRSEFNGYFRDVINQAIEIADSSEENHHNWQNIAIDGKNAKEFADYKIMCIEYVLKQLSFWQKAQEYAVMLNPKTKQITE